MFEGTGNVQLPVTDRFRFDFPIYSNDITGDEDEDEMISKGYILVMKNRFVKMWETPDNGYLIKDSLGNTTSTNNYDYASDLFSLISKKVIRGR